MSVSRLPPALHPLQYEDLVRRALLEDLGGAGDITTDALIEPTQQAAGLLAARRAGRVAGLQVALDVFRLLDPGLRAVAIVADGADVAAGAALAQIEASARALLTAERTALNLLGRLCGIATATRDVVERLAGLPTQVACTRKTTPGLRLLEKHAVRCGGGSAHRFGLDDAILIKDNHRALAGGVHAAVARARAACGHLTKLEVEVDTLAQLDEVLELGVDAVLLDNLPLDDLREAVRRCRGRLLTEASGGVTPENAREVAATGVDVISMGFLTHSAAALDVGLDIECPASDQRNPTPAPVPKPRG